MVGVDRRADNCPLHKQSGCVEVSLSDAFLNKNNLTGSDRAFDTSFHTVNAHVGKLVRHIQDGGAFAPAVFDGNRSKANFRSAQIIGLDFDDNVSLRDCLRTRGIRDYAFFIGETFSSTPQNPRTRVLFLLQKPVHDADVYEGHIRAVLSHFSSLRPDTACRDAARLFFGNQTDGYDCLYRADKVLPAQVLEGWNLTSQHRQRPKPRQIGISVPMPGTALSVAVSAISGATEGIRHNMLLSRALPLFGRVKAGMLDAGEVRAALRSAAMMAGLPELEVERVIDWTWDKATVHRIAHKVAGNIGPSDVARQASVRAKRHDLRLFDALRLSGVKPGAVLTARLVADRLKRRGLRPSVNTIRSALSEAIFADGVMPTVDQVNTIYDVPDKLRYKSTRFNLEMCRTPKAYRERLQLEIYARRESHSKATSHSTVKTFLGVSRDTVRRSVRTLSARGMLTVIADRKRHYEVAAGKGDTGWVVQESNGGRIVHGVKRGLWHFIRQSANRYIVDLQACVTQMHPLLSYSKGGGKSAVSQPASPQIAHPHQPPPNSDPSMPDVLIALRRKIERLRRYKFAVLMKAVPKSTDGNYADNLTTVGSDSSGGSDLACSGVAAKNASISSGLKNGVSDYLLATAADLGATVTLVSSRGSANE